MATKHGDGALWFVAGLALGATFALLYAPESGEDTRKRIRKAARRSAGQLKDSGRNLIDRGMELADEATEMLERGRSLIHEAAFEEEEA